MGWWDSLWASSASADDPLRKLDPKLREFLEKESPVKYSSNTPQTQTSTQSIYKTTELTPSAEGESESRREPAVPRESQFQDGRYAHIWKTYRPLAEIEAETKSDHEKLMDVLEGYKERKSQIGRAALENCALEQVDWRTCMANPSLTERMTMCRDQVKKFEKCYMTQTVRSNMFSCCFHNSISLTMVTYSDCSKPSATSQRSRRPHKSKRTSRCTPTHYTTGC
jgi:hypothetical protein